MLEHLSFGFGRKLPVLLQTEATECGLACLGMVAGYHGLRIDMPTLRQRHAFSLKGACLGDLMGVAAELGLSSRAVKLDLDDLAKLRKPCILHWNFNHFVVLHKVSARYVVLHDPAMGLRRLPLSDVSAAFTGVALELWPGPNFKPVEARQRIRLRQLSGDIVGLRRAMIQALLLALALEVFFIVGPFLLQWVADEVLVSADHNLLNVLAIGFGLMLLMQVFVTLVRGWVLMYLSTSLSMQWHANAFSHLLNLPADYFEKRHLGDVVSRFGSIDTIQRTITTSFLEAILDGVMAILTLVLMALYSVDLCLVAVAAMTLYALGRWLWFAPLRNATEEQIVHAAKQQSHFLETVRGITSIKLFQRHEHRRSRWLSLLVEQVNAELRSNKITQLYQALNRFLFGSEHILVIWLGARLVMEQGLTIGMLLAFIAYKTQFDTRIGALIDKWIEMRMLKLQAERLADILLSRGEAATSPALTDRDEPFTTPGVEVRHLFLRYGEQEADVLCDISFSVEPGECVALTGPSGSGKSSLVRVLLGLLPPTEGQVLIDGQNVERWGLDAWRSITGAVLQDDVLFAGSIAENISFFDEQPDREWLRECARMAAISADIETMPMGYNTMIGDMGSVLSGGQKQRLLLARALYRRPSVLILDEATSHLDVELEHKVNEAICELRMTRIIVAHRPQTIAAADRVVRLVGGTVTQ